MWASGATRSELRTKKREIMVDSGVDAAISLVPLVGPVVGEVKDMSSLADDIVTLKEISDRHR